MLDEIIPRAKGLLLHPEETFRNSRNDTAEQVLVYVFLLLVFDAFIASAILSIGAGYLGFVLGKFLPAGSLFPLAVFGLVILAGFIWAILIGAWFHLWVWLLGGRNGIFSTAKAVCYGMTPVLLLGWIPVFGIVFAIWTLVLDVIGIRELQDMSTGRAAVAVFIAIVIPAVLVILAAAWFLVASSVVTTPVTAPMPL